MAHPNPSPRPCTPNNQAVVEEEAEASHLGPSELQELQNTASLSSLNNMCSQLAAAGTSPREVGKAAELFLEHDNSVDVKHEQVPVALAHTRSCRGCDSHSLAFLPCSYSLASVCNFRFPDETTTHACFSARGYLPVMLATSLSRTPHTWRRGLWPSSS